MKMTSPVVEDEAPFLHVRKRILHHMDMLSFLEMFCTAKFCKHSLCAALEDFDQDLLDAVKQAEKQCYRMDTTGGMNSALNIFPDISE